MLASGDVVGDSGRSKEESLAWPSRVLLATGDSDKKLSAEQLCVAESKFGWSLEECGEESNWRRDPRNANLLQN